MIAPSRHIPAKYRATYEQAMRGKSREAAMRAFCLDCCGWEIKEVFLCADADNLPFLDRSFDQIFTFTLLQNMPNPSKTLKEICRVANTGSQVIITVTKKVFGKRGKNRVS